MLACGGDDGYDVETWQSPLASEFDGEPDADEGESIFFEEHWEDGSSYALVCASCHHADAEDTFQVDSDAYNRPAHTVWNAPYREVWKGTQDWDEEESDVLGAYGGEICIKAYFPSPSVMTPAQAAHLEAYMKTLRDPAKPTGDDRAEPLDFSFNTWESQEEFVARVQDDSGAWLYGPNLGNVEHGEELAARFCGACHTRDGAVDPGYYYTEATQDLGTWIARIRRTAVGDTDRPNVRMPRLTIDRLSDDELFDILAFVTAHYGNR
jgi:mono/diheme cytochrome c family protein